MVCGAGCLEIRHENYVIRIQSLAEGEGFRSFSHMPGGRQVLRAVVVKCESGPDAGAALNPDHALPNICRDHGAILRRFCAAGRHRPWSPAQIPEREFPTLSRDGTDRSRAP